MKRSNESERRSDAALRWAGSVRLPLALAGGAILVGVLALARLPSARRPAAETVQDESVIAGSFEVWSSYEGVLEARHMERVTAPVDGSAVLMEIVPEGTRVHVGDLLARFDMTDAEAERVRLQHERTRVHTEWIGLREAELPLETLDLDAQVFEAEHRLETERRFLTAVQDLAGRGVVDPEEVERQDVRVAGLQTRLAQAQTRRDLTIGHMHPARLARVEAARATLDAQLERVSRRIENGRVRAPSDGVVVHLPLPLGGGFRAAHIGDTLHRNQAFIALPDMRDPVVRLRIPESDLPRVAPGAPVRVRPLAFPDRVFEGAVEQVGAMAQSVPGESSRRKGFPVRVALTDGDAGLPAGITVRIDVQSYATEHAVQVPRLAVVWNGEQPEVRVRENGRTERRPVTLGWAGEATVEVLGGLEPGERVVVP